MTNSKRFLSKCSGWLLVACFSCALLTSCGVKKRDVTTAQHPVTSAEIPDGVNSTKNRKFLFRSSTGKLVAGEENPISYFVVTDGLTYPGPETSLDIEYRMTSMPGMGTTKMTLTATSPGRFDAIYDISMGGDWEIKILVKQNDTVIDEIIYSFMVPEG